MILPGSEVLPDRFILGLSNPELELSTSEAQSELAAGESEWINLRVQLRSQLLSQQVFDGRIVEGSSPEN